MVLVPIKAKVYEAGTVGPQQPQNTIIFSINRQKLVSQNESKDTEGSHAELAQPSCHVLQFGESFSESTIDRPPGRNPVPRISADMLITE